LVFHSHIVPADDAGVERIRAHLAILLPVINQNMSKRNYVEEILSIHLRNELNPRIHSTQDCSATLKQKN